jgi:hypothetical protein
MNVQTAPVAVALFLIAAIVLWGFTLYASQCGKIRAVYTGIAGGLLGLIFSILIVMFTGNLLMASAIGIIIFGWFMALGRARKKPKVLFGKAK